MLSPPHSSAAHSLGAVAAAAGPVRAVEETLRNATGRDLVLPARAARVFPAGPPAAILFYTLVPDLLIGWPRALRP